MCKFVCNLFGFITEIIVELVSVFPKKLIAINLLYISRDLFEITL